MNIDLGELYRLARYWAFDEFEQELKSRVSKQPVTVIIPGDLKIDIELIKPKSKLTPDSFKLFRRVANYFSRRFYTEKPWLECYDRLVRIDKYTEEEILDIVSHFRSEGNWWRDSGNFETLLKLRRINPEKVKYIDVLSNKLKKESTRSYTGFPIGNIINKADGKQRGY
jgi:hypothetical protein